MFTDYFVRCTTRLPAGELGFLRESGLNPELYLTARDLTRIKQEGQPNLGEILGHFPSNTLHAPFFDISPGGFDEEIRALSYDKLKMVMGIAERFQSELVVVHFNYYEIYYQENFSRWLERTADFFRRLLEESRQIPIALENISESTPEVVQKLLAAIDNPRLIHCFDVGHFNVFSRISLEEWLRRIAAGGKIHFHFHDNLGDCDSHLPVGDGNIQWGRLKKIITALFDDFTVTLESHSRKDLERSLGFYRKFFIT